MENGRAEEQERRDVNHRPPDEARRLPGGGLLFPDGREWPFRPTREEMPKPRLFNQIF